MARRRYWAVSATALSLAGVAVLLRYTVVRVTVRGSSMAPVCEAGARVLVHRGGRIAVGRVVVLECPVPAVSRHLPSVHRAASSRAVAARRWIIKRVGRSPATQPAGPRAGPGPSADHMVPPGRLVLLGDNPMNSDDSRQAGYFPVERVLGTVVGHQA
ncbi:S26 family signal peptidase [Streptomyces sp. NBC_01142]|uniref:S26 family signal peptidase n=1 Tax=Streptomyces sp. NBC_01142 TaxID=2975865 RepID=UPI0022530C16|nr:S26 family signal peptidase [Streptomyces sp. NBC_01142]MCX4825746.1 S26 family signal peptidase [Streptomyces sp. NBC_01142]